jgi:hypothetical protein
MTVDVRMKDKVDKKPEMGETGLGKQLRDRTND